MQEYSGEILYRVLIEGVVNLDGPRCPECRAADGMYILAPQSDSWTLSIHDTPCGYTKMTLSFGPTGRLAVLNMFSWECGFHRFVGDATPNDEAFLLCWESDDGEIPCDFRAASVRVERLVADRPMPALTTPQKRQVSFDREQDPIQLLADRPWNRGRLEDAHLRGEAVSTSSGTLDLFMKLGRGPDGSIVVERATYEHTGSRPGAAYAALLALLVEGQALSEIRKISAEDLHEFVGPKSMDRAAAEMAMICLRSALSNC